MVSPSWGSLFAFAALTRVAVLAFGYLAGHHLPPIPFIEQAHSTPPQSLVATFYRWDASFYITISREGYTYVPGQYCTAAFMPLLPVMMAIDSMFGVDRYLAGLATANLAFVIGLMFFGRAVLLSTKNAATTWKACALLAAFPTAFFFSCPYQESLAFLAMSLAWWAWLQERPGLAAGSVFFGCLARLTSAMFPVALLLEWLWNAVRRKPNRSLVSIIAIGLAGLAAIGLFCLYLQVNVGDALAHMKAHEAWNRKPPAPQNIGRSLIYLFYYYPRDGNWHSPVVAGGALVLFTALGLRALKVRGVFAGAMILLPILQALSTGTPMSLERILLASFFAFVDLAEVLKKPWMFWTVLGVCAALQMYLLNGYVHFQFVG